MAIELKFFGDALFPKDKALKENPELKPLAIAVKAANKSSAEIIIAGKLMEFFPANTADYFKAKVWEVLPELPQVPVEPGVFCSEYFGIVATWSADKGEPVAIKSADDGENTQSTESALKPVARLDQTSRAACLALFGAIAEISPSQYGQIVDLVNDDVGSFTRELAEALAKERRALELAPERQEQLLAWVRENTKESAQWPDIKKQIAKWIDTPADKRPRATSASNDTHTDTGSTLGGGNKTDRSPDLVHNLSTLKTEVAVAILSLFDEIDIYAIPSKFLMPAKAMAEAEQDTRFTGWWKQLRGTPGILDYSRAAIIALIKSAPEDIWLNPIELRQYINRELVESKHDKPDQKTIDIARSPKQRTVPENRENDETRPPVQDKTDLPAVCPAKAAQLDKELTEAFAQNCEPEKQTNDQPKVENLGGGVFSVDALINTPSSNQVEKQEVPPAMTDREIEIAYALNDLLSGRTDIIHNDDAEYLITCTGHHIEDLFPLLIADIITTELCLSPDFSNEDIRDIAYEVIVQWSDDVSVRQKIALDTIVEYRRPEPPKAATAKPETPPEPAVIEPVNDVTTLTYRQQLTIAALQGLCANPAYVWARHDLPEIAIAMVDGVISQQEAEQ